MPTAAAPARLTPRPFGRTGLRGSPLDPARLEEVRRSGDAVHAAARGGARWIFRQG